MQITTEQAIRKSINKVIVQKGEQHQIEEDRGR